MSNPDTTTVRCPSCGAPITMGPERGVCSYCETVVERKNAKRPPKTAQQTYSHSSSVVHISTTTVSRKATQSPKKSGSVGCTFAFVVGIILFASVILFSTGAISLTPITSALGITANGWPVLGSERISDLIQVVPRDAASDDMLVLLSKDDDMTLGLISTDGSTLRWQSAPLGGDAREAAVALGSETVYVADKTQLQALRLSDGSMTWQAQLPVEVLQYCKECFKVVGDSLVALLQDGTVQALNMENGETLWNTRLDNPPRHIESIGDQLVLTQGIEDEWGAELRLVDPASGEVAWRVKPRCAPADESQSEARFYPDSIILPTADNEAFFTVFDGCAQRWSIGANEPDWQTRLSQDVKPMSTSWDTPNIILSESYILLANQQGALSTINTDTGALATPLHDEEYQLTPLFARDNIAAVKATPTWDYNRHNLWGVDLATGERRWQYAMQAKEWFGDSGFNEWGAQLTPEGITVVQVPEETKELIVERLNVQTGASRGRQVTSLSDESSLVVWNNFWTDRMAWLELGSSLYTIDLLSGEFTRRER